MLILESVTTSYSAISEHEIQPASVIVATLIALSAAVLICGQRMDPRTKWASRHRRRRRGWRAGKLYPTSFFNGNVNKKKQVSFHKRSNVDFPFLLFSTSFFWWAMTILETTLQKVIVNYPGYSSNSPAQHPSKVGLGRCCNPSSSFCSGFPGTVGQPPYFLDVENVPKPKIKHLVGGLVEPTHLKNMRKSNWIMNPQISA